MNFTVLATFLCFIFPRNFSLGSRRFTLKCFKFLKVLGDPLTPPNFVMCIASSRLAPPPHPPHIQFFIFTSELNTASIYNMNFIMLIRSYIIKYSIQITVTVLSMPNSYMCNCIDLDRQIVQMAAHHVCIYKLYMLLHSQETRDILHIQFYIAGLIVVESNHQNL